MRRVLWIVGAVLALFAAFVIAAFFLIDAEKLREPLREAASKALGREVTIGGLDLDLLPLPSLEASELRVAGARADTPDFAQVASVRLRVALLPLLRKQVVVRALELQQPRIFVSLDREGRPELPGAAGGSDASRAEPAPAPERTSATPSLAVQSLRIRKGDLRYGDWQLSGLDVDGSLGLDGAGRARIRTNLQGPVRASAVDADTRFQLDLASGELRAASAEVHVDELDYASGETRLRGPVDLSASLGQRWSVDFRGAELRVPGAVHKKAGTQLSLAGELAQVPSPESLGPFDVRLAGSELRVTPELARGRVSVAGPLDLAALRPVLDPGLPELGGQITLDGMGVELEGIRLFGAASLDAVTAPTPQGQILVSGQLRGRGRQLVLEQGRAEIGGQPVQLDASYDLDSGKAKLQTRTSEAQVKPMLAAFTEQQNLEGLLASNAQLELTGGVETLSGRARLDLTSGRIQGFSLLRQVLGDLAAVPVLVASAKGKDLSRYESEEFEELSGDFDVRHGVLSTSNLLLRYKHATAHLRGSVGLQTGGALDLTGRVELAREVDAELGKTSGKPTVIPIAHIGGTVDRPRVQIDRETLAQIALTYAGSDRVREKLEEKIGPGAAEAVEGLLDVLRGGGQKR